MSPERINITIHCPNFNGTMEEDFKIEGSKEELLQEAYEKGRSYEKECTGCAQTVVASVLDTLGIQNEDVFKAASGLADGIGLTGNASCGALTGGAMVLSYLYGRDRDNFSDMYAAMDSYRLAKKLHDRFVDKYDSPRCFDIQENFFGRTFDLYDSQEMEEAFDEGMMEECSKVVGNTARLTVEIILEKERETENNE